jgi:hypothetical protein
VTPEQRRARGYAAKALIDDPTLQSAWAELENDLRTEWERCWLPRKRDRIWNELKHLRGLRGKLANFAAHGRE